MPNVADALRRYGPEYLERFGAAMSAEHKKALQAIMACRTGQLGIVLYEYTSCGRTQAMGRSCGNRHCPSCQQDKTKAWLETQTDRLLPCPYFLLTFTVPAALRRLDPQSSAHRVRRVVRGVQRGDQDLGGESQVCRCCAVWLLRSAAHLGPHPGLSSPRPLRGAGRGSHRRRSEVVAVACPFLRARACSVDPLSPSSATLWPAPACWRRSIVRCGVKRGWSILKPLATAGRR